MVVDPIADTLTHLVIEPEHRHGLGRLVPLDLTDVVAGDIRLRCTLAEFTQLELGEETQFLPVTSGWAGLRSGAGARLAGQPSGDSCAPAGGHLLARKDVAIPIGVVAGLDGGIRLRIAKRDAQDLPAVDVEHPDW